MQRDAFTQFQQIKDAAQARISQIDQTGPKTQTVDEPAPDTKWKAQRLATMKTFEAAKYHTNEQLVTMDRVMSGIEGNSWPNYMMSGRTMAALSAVSANIARFSQHLDMYSWDETSLNVNQTQRLICKNDSDNLMMKYFSSGRKPDELEAIQEAFLKEFRQQEVPVFPNNELKE